MKFERIKPGATLYDAHTYRMGNTKMRSWGVWDVNVISVDEQTRSAVVSWNGNRPERWFERALRKLREKRPVLVSCGLGERLATREEIKTMGDPVRRATGRVRR